MDAKDVTRAQEMFHGPKSEQALVLEAQAGCIEAMNELLLRYKTVLYRVVRRFTTNHEDTEDLVQDVMLRAFVKIGTFRNQSRFATWLIAIANNAAISLKRRGRNVSFFSLEGESADFSGVSRREFRDNRPDPEQDVVRRELLTIVRTVLQRQPRIAQVLVDECVFNEGRLRDVASSLGLGIDSAKSKLFRARRRVSESFERRGLIKRPITKTSRHVEP
jgi:RNA polymerase sigma-70 factor (ECF subfamily)